MKVFSACFNFFLRKMSKFVVQMPPIYERLPRPVPVVSVLGDPVFARI